MEDRRPRIDRLNAARARRIQAEEAGEEPPSPRRAEIPAGFDPERSRQRLDELAEEMSNFGLGMADEIYHARIDLELSYPGLTDALGRGTLRRLRRKAERSAGWRNRRHLEKLLREPLLWPHRRDARPIVDEAPNTIEVIDREAFLAFFDTVKSDSGLKSDLAAGGTWAATGSFGAGATVSAIGTAIANMGRMAARDSRTANPLIENPTITGLCSEYDELHRPLFEWDFRDELTSWEVKGREKEQRREAQMELIRKHVGTAKTKLREYGVLGSDRSQHAGSSDPGDSEQGSTPSGAGLADELERLAALRTAGAITEGEFRSAKTRLLGSESDSR